VADGAERVPCLFDAELTDVSGILVESTEPPSVPPLWKERSVDVFSELVVCVRMDGLTELTAGAFSELAFATEGDDRFIASCTPARIASASATLTHAIGLETRLSL